ncbi:hypothetical protein OROMI_020545 [Orobanche minor]
MDANLTSERNTQNQNHSDGSVMALQHKLFHALISLFSLFSVVALAGEKKERKTYLVHVKNPEGNLHVTRFHESFLPVTHPRLLYSYKHVMSGFAARLTAEEVEAMKEKEGFISASPERTSHPATTHSPQFLGLSPGTGLWNQSKYGRGVIIGVVDSGISPRHPSFKGDNMPPPPLKWKGRCDFKVDECNNKLIGARSFTRAANVSNTDDTKPPPLDDTGHGTHTAGTAAGRFVEDASFLGNAHGTAAGMAPEAHLAIYRVCSKEECADSDLLLMMESMSSVEKGILVSCSAGNYGPFPQTVVNAAPWILTVGAATIDRSIKATAKLGNGQTFDGEAAYQPKEFPRTLLPLVYAGSNGKQDSAFCEEGSLAGIDIEGKVVVCDRGVNGGSFDKGGVVLNAGGAAMILANQEAVSFSLIAEDNYLPATHVSYIAGLQIKSYINSTDNPTATILFRGTVMGDPLAPTVASFSARGPSLLTPGILKPDIIGPGVGVLAAWRTRSDIKTFIMFSGTSMSCPHLSGVAALLKSTHPHWSPAAIKSAIMTTADLLNVGGSPIVDEKHTPADVFATGAGHVDPWKANSPGLVYDMEMTNYIPYLCGLGYTEEQVRKVARRSVSCTSKIPQGQLNYPTFSLHLDRSLKFSTGL